MEGTPAARPHSQGCKFELGLLHLQGGRELTHAHCPLSAVEPVNEYNVILKEQKKLFLDTVMAFKNVFDKYPAATSVVKLGMVMCVWNPNT